MALEHVRVGDPHSDAHNNERDAINDISNDVAGLRTDITSLATANSQYIKREFDTEPINVAHYGYDESSIYNAIAAAEDRGPGTVLYFPAGTYDIGGGLILSGRSCVIRGDGSGGTSAKNGGTTLVASAQTGAAIDLTGYSVPDLAQGRAIFEGFRIVGSGAADSSKKRAGIKAGTVGGLVFRDIAVYNVGGPSIDLTTTAVQGAFQQTWEDIVLSPSISAAAGDVPAFLATNAVECRFSRFTINGTSHGVSGAAVVQSSGSGYSRANIFTDWTFSKIVLATNGTLFNMTGNANVISNFQYNTITKGSSVNGSSFVRFNKTSSTGDGQNLYLGMIPGATTATDPDCGIDLRQNNDTIIGAKTGNAMNVVLVSGASYNSIRLSGLLTSGEYPSVSDNSGNQTNSWEDLGNDFRRNRGWEMDSDGTYPRFTNTGTGDNGGIAIARAGVRLVASNGNGPTLSIRAANVYLDAPGGTSNPPVIMLNSSSAGATIRSGTGSPAGKVSAGQGSIYVQTDGGAGKTLWIKETGTATSSGWVSK